MSFAAPEPIGNIDKSKVCDKCGVYIKNPISPSWESGKCPSCYDHDTYKEIDVVDNSNPLDTVVKPALMNPVTFYLDKYTHTEIKNVSQIETRSLSQMYKSQLYEDHFKSEVNRI